MIWEALVNLLWLAPPVAFLVALAFVLIELVFLRVFSAGTATGGRTEGSLKAYACGENVSENRVRPDYSQFFPFAFFFTIMHVVALMVATGPGDSVFAVVMAAIYIAVAFAGLFILFRK